MIVINHGGPVSDINISKKTTISGIFDEMAESGGFESVNMAEGLDILAQYLCVLCIINLFYVGSADKKIGILWIILNPRK